MGLLAVRRIRPLVFYRAGEHRRCCGSDAPGAARCGDGTTRAIAGGLLVPLQDGSVILADPATGREPGACIPSIVPVGVPTQWSRPAVRDGTQEFVTADQPSCHLSRWRRGQASKELAVLGEKPIEGDVVGPWACRGEHLLQRVTSGAGDRVWHTRFPRSLLRKNGRLAGRLLWGPRELAMSFCWLRRRS